MISVIVPVYNVEPYLRQCLDSLVEQTFTDVEIILIDDGSVDGCPQICDAYREQDDRFVVFHTENRGLSAARNLGIDNARGEWIMFVDSDDWVEPGFCELPYRAALENRADLVIFDLTRIGFDGVDPRRKPLAGGVVSAQYAVDNGYYAAWNKLYLRSLFETVRYPEGRVNEDIARTHRLVYKARRIVLLEEALYNYRNREGSITNRKDRVKLHDTYLAHLERYDDLIRYGYPKEKLDLFFLAVSLHYLMRTDPGDDELYRRADEMASSYQGDVDGLKAHERNALKIWRLSKTLFHEYYRGKKL